jgi:hypothetical protein
MKQPSIDPPPRSFDAEVAGALLAALSVCMKEKVDES